MGRRLLALALLLCGVVQHATAYSLTGTRWNSSSTTMHLQLGPAAAALSDGSSSWGASAEDALNTWNSYLGTFRFNVVRDSTVTRAQGNGTNNVFFSGDVYGTAWGTGVLAVTLTYSAGTSQTETDVLFNTQFNWNSYRGALRYTSTGAPIYDFHRVAMHEFGHVLGLDHPDENGQSVTALMNSRISALDALAADDISGGQSIYGATASTTVSPPVITSQPASRTVTAGSVTSFNVSVSSAAPVSYQWLKNGGFIAGATSSTLAFNSASSSDAGSYVVVVSNSAGSITSAAATLTVTTPPPTTVTPSPPPPPPQSVVVAPTIATQPTSAIVNAGSAVSFTVSANGSSPLAYQWRKDGVAISGATASAYAIGSAQPADAGAYSVTVSNSAGSVTSVTATLAVNTAPVISSQPADQIVTAGGRISLNVAASGTAPLHYQWRKDDADLSGATDSSFAISPARAADAGSYTVVVSNIAGSVTSARAVVTVNVPPVAVTAPADQTVALGAPVMLTVAASGVPAPVVQWQKDGNDIAGATDASLTIAAAQLGDAGSYRARLTNAAGSITTASATLTVRFSRLVNLSTRAFVPQGGTLTPGFYVRGAAAKPLLVRAVGPTLTLFGIGTALAETSLDIVAQDTAAVVASNAGWGGGAALDNTFARVGAFPLAADSKDAAVQANLPPRAYTVRVTPTEAGLSGVTLAEIYDADPRGTGAQLVNLSTLGYVGVGENVLTAGFVIDGNAPKRLLIRAVGPGLEPFGVSDRLSNPQLSVTPLGGSEAIATNDDWPDVPETRAAFASAGAFILPSSSKDAAVVLTLQPGAYTVTVSGVGQTTGNALVEIYDLD
jgi:hypothetical protein